MRPSPRFRYDDTDRGLRVRMCPTIALESFCDSNSYMIGFLCTRKGLISNRPILNDHYIEPVILCLILLNFRCRYFLRRTVIY
jgi:hypothetical protein